MINGTLRPWGKATWFFQLPTVQNLKWFIVGNVSTQERCSSVLRQSKTFLNVLGTGLVEIDDSPKAPTHFNQKSAKKLADNRQACRLHSTVKPDIVQCRLLDPLMELKGKLHDWIERSAGNIVLDVSTMPERFCFPVIRWLMESSAVRNLIVTYMLAEAYTQEDLGYDVQDWGQLPTFGSVGDSKSEMVEHVIVGVGFLPYSLAEWLTKTYNTRPKISLLLPFPAPPSSVNRAWEFVRLIERDLGPLPDDRRIIRVAPNDLPSAFQRIESITGTGRQSAVFAPYGPKPHSLSMGLHAIRHASEVYFTQPTYYHPEYTTGIAEELGHPLGYAYAIRLDGKCLYV